MLFSNLIDDEDDEYDEYDEEINEEKDDEDNEDDEESNEEKDDEDDEDDEEINDKKDDEDDHERKNRLTQSEIERNLRIKENNDFLRSLGFDVADAREKRKEVIGGLVPLTLVYCNVLL